MRKGVSASLFIFFLSLLIPVLVHATQTVHKVKKGENLQSIAKKYHIAVNELKRIANLRTSKLRTGQTLVFDIDKPARYTLQGRKSDKKQPEIFETQSTENDGEFIEYKVKKGDTVTKLAQLFNVDESDLIESNNLQKLKNKKLSPGKVILVPKVVDEGEEEIVNLPTKPFKPWKDGDEKYMMVKVAKSFMGAPYKYGGNTVRGLDCSAYVRKIYEIFDVQLPRSAREQFMVGSKIRREELSVGDLVFFKTKRFAKYPTHVGIYIGDGSFIHSSSGNGRIGVKIDSLSSDYYSRAYTGATRVKDGCFDENPVTSINSNKL
ncbi:MAG TPA: NlpC/P60 family protein [Syntrophorhabdaceae bacterium]|nr:NlpC/P60 family protein [Syntrophorhabdaceae bacterium]